MAQRILRNKRLKIFVDSREINSIVFYKLIEMDVEILKTNLDVADYVCSDRVAIERKTVRDFLQSIVDNRIFKQVEKLVQYYEKPLLIIEGNQELLFIERNIHENAIRGALSSLVVDYRLPIIWCYNSSDTAKQIYWIAFREQKKEDREIKVYRQKRIYNLKDMQEFLIAGLPNISGKMSVRLLKYFKKPINIFNASITQLMSVNGIGKERAKIIRKVLDSFYD